MLRRYLFVFAVLFVVAGHLAGEVDPMVKSKVLEVFQGQYPFITAKDVRLKVIRHAHLSANFYGVPFYQLILGVSLPPRHKVVSVLDDQVFVLPYDFNKLLVERGMVITTQNVVDMAFSFVLLADPEAIGYIKLDRESVEIQEKDKKIERVEFITYSSLGGIKKRWQFVIRDRQIMEVYETVMEKRVGDYTVPDEDYHSFKRSSGIPRVYFLKLYRSTEVGKGVPKFFFGLSKKYVVIRGNGAPTPESERTTTILASGLVPGEVCSLRVSSLDTLGAITDTGNFLRACTTADASGELQYHWIPSGDPTQPSDLMKIQLKSGPSWYTMYFDTSEGPHALLDRKYAQDPFDVDPDFALAVYYCTGYENYIGTNPGDFSQAVWDAMVESYDSLVKTWDLGRPYDQDNVYDVFINDGSNPLHGCDDNLAFPGEDRKIGIRCNSFGDHSYSSVQARVNGAVVHEFLHGIQATYGNNHCFIWGKSGDWIIEGQARAIPSIVYEQEEFGNIHHFYPEDANRYLLSYLDKSLKNQSYRYCMYWRFLYENYWPGATQAQKMSLWKNAVIQAANQESVGQDAVVGGELAMDAALASSGGIYTTFDNCIDSFAIANALVEDYYEPDSLYEKPKIILDLDDDGITATFSGATVRRLSYIANPFGINYMTFDFSESGNFVSLYFLTDPDSDGTKPDFDAQFILKRGTDTRRFTMQMGTYGADTVFQKGEGDTLWVVVTRLDVNPLVGFDRTYEVILSSPDFATITYPNGGEYLMRGDSCEIKWLPGSAKQNVKLELYKGGAYHSTIADTTPDDGSFVWDIDPAHETGDDYKVKMTGLEDTAFYDYSNKNFSICSPIVVIYPNGGETWYGNQEVIITWEPSGGGGNVRIELSVDGGASWGYSVSDVSDDGSFTALVPVDQTSHARVRVTHIGCPSNLDMSDADFNIEYTPATVWTVTDPYTGAGADTITGTLPWASNGAWQNPNPDRIVFGISGTFYRGTMNGVWLEDGDFLDGTNAPGGLHSVILDSIGVYLRGSNSGVIGMVLYGGNPSMGRGVHAYGDSLENISICNNVISGCNTGIYIQNARNCNIYNNNLGTDISGLNRIGNAAEGIFIDRSSRIYISGNVISGSGEDGIFCSGNDADSLFVSGNLIGMNATGTDTIGNDGWGIIKSLVVLPQVDTISRWVRITDNCIAGNRGGVFVGHEAVTTEDLIIRDNYIGTDTSGRVALGNGHGVSIYNCRVPIIENNLISGNDSTGIVINDGGGMNLCVDSAIIRNNLIGLNISGDSALGNGKYGIEGSIRRSIITNNCISGNHREAIYIHNTYGINADSNFILGNLIGTDTSGTVPIHNYTYGDIEISSNHNQLGNDSLWGRNIIANGIAIYGDSNRVSGNYIGIDRTGMTAIAGDYTSGIYMVAAHYNEIHNNIISGFDLGGGGWYFSGGISLRGCGHNAITSNTVGVNLAGEPVPNKHGIYIGPAYEPNVGNIVKDNLVSGNNENGIFVSNADSTEIQGNFVGTDEVGFEAVHNGGYGISDSISTNTRIGDNLITDGIYLFLSNSSLISGNFIGTDISGMEALGKQDFDGIYLESSHYNEIQQNLISGNGRDGVRMFNSENNTLKNNDMGIVSQSKKLAEKKRLVSHNRRTDMLVALSDRGSAMDEVVGIRKNNVPLLDNLVEHDKVGEDIDSLPNAGHGINIEGGKKNIIGVGYEGNMIAGNNLFGIRISDSDSNDVYLNTIGTSEVGNDLDGVAIMNSAQYNTVRSNGIAGNGGCGVIVLGSNSDYNTIMANTIYDNAALGIDLGGDGVTENDLGDIDMGPNEGLNYPVIESMEEVGTNLFDIYGTAASGCEVELYWVGPTVDASGHGEGYELRGTASADSTGNFKISTVRVSAGQLLSSIAIDTDNNTSEFSDTIRVPGVFPSIVLSSEAYDFDSVLVNDSSDTSSWIYNVGVANLFVYDMLFAGESKGDTVFSVVSPVQFPQIVPPGDSIQVTVRFTPPDTGFFYDTLGISSNDPGTSIFLVPTSGIGYYQAGVESMDKIPAVFFVRQNAPNPFSRSTLIRYGLPRKSRVSMKLYNLVGELVRVFVDEEKDPGYYAVVLDSRRLASGTYFVKFTAGDCRKTYKLILVKGGSTDE